MKSIAIMQPTFLPWLGYFALIDSVDEFVFFDHVQFEKRSWQQRNKIKTANGPIWLSVPVSTKGKQFQTIQDTEILYEGDKNPLDKITKSIELNYQKAPFYQDYADDIFSAFAAKPQYISELNQTIIKYICHEIGIQTPFINSSSLDVSGKKDILLVDICQAREATHYISPPGSKVYLDESDAFEGNNIHLSYHEYIHPEYAQLHDGFEPYMCILDLLFNEGPESKHIIQRGAPKP
tara:strand:+ start:232329 stop:233036 length:708 start_codon:yes stop_codon:yes gene_type:complete